MFEVKSFEEGCAMLDITDVQERDGRVGWQMEMQLYVCVVKVVELPKLSS